MVSQSVKVEIQALSDKVNWLQVKMQSHFEQQHRDSISTIETNKLMLRLNVGVTDIHTAIDRLGIS